jgi:hypothetical protein
MEDLVLAKKTQRDKDWPMIRRLVEQNYQLNRDNPSESSIRFWLRQLRTPELLREVMEQYPEQASMVRKIRPALNAELETSIRSEEDAERARDREYWKPLREELEQLQFQKGKPGT